MKNHISLEDFFSLREKTEQVMEYIDGTVFMSPSPSTRNQRISGKLFNQLFNLLEAGECEVFPAPFDIQLKKENSNENTIVVPDITVICDKSGFTEARYVGVPEIIIEIISPTNQSHDLVYKLNLYQKYCVKEYWIVNPLLNTVQVYSLELEGQYRQMDVARNSGIIQSDILKGFSVDLGKLFE